MNPLPQHVRALHFSIILNSHILLAVGGGSENGDDIKEKKPRKRRTLNETGKEILPVVVENPMCPTLLFICMYRGNTVASGHKARFYLRSPIHKIKLKEDVLR